MSALLDTVLVVTLLWTNPDTKAAQVWVPPSLRETFADSMGVDCDLPGTEFITDLDSAFVYAWPISGGPRRRVHAKSVRGREGLPDSVGPLSFPGWPGAHFDVTFRRIGSKESCPSNRVYKALPTVTAVEPESRRPRVIVERWYDVHGRAIDVQRHTGIAWVRWTVRGRFIGSQKAVVVRGRVVSPLRRPSP